MSIREHQTYFAYREGYDEAIVRIGNLVFDFANPRERQPYIHSDLIDQAKWATADQRAVCTLAGEEERHCSLGIGLQDILNFDTVSSRDSYYIAVGTNGSKVELKEPEEFFHSVILQSPRAVHWLETRLSIISKLELQLKKSTFRGPKIWFLTGVYLMTDAFYLIASRQGNILGVAASVPAPNPAGVAALLGISVGGKLQLQSGTMMTSSAQILGKRVWAAQWQLVDVKYVSAAHWRSQWYKNGIRLRSSMSLAGRNGSEERDGMSIRAAPRAEVRTGLPITKMSSEAEAEDVAGQVALVELVDKGFMEEVDSDNGFVDEEFWDHYEREIILLE